MRKSALIIRIPEPCHQPWDDMKPEHNGRYCGSCEKVVVDFTGKTDQEIAAHLQAHAGEKMCGRFRSGQVNRPIPLTIDVEAVRRAANPRVAFAAALLLVFGTGLVSCSDHQDKKLRIDKIEMRESGMIAGLVLAELPPEADEPKDEATSKGAAMFLTGEVDPPARETDRAPGKTHKVDSTTRKTATEPEADSLCNGQTFPPDSMVQVESEIQHCFIVGGLTATYSEEITIPDSPSPAFSAEMVAPEITVYPNPGDGHFTVKYTVKERCAVRLEVVDLQGRTLLPVVDIPAQHSGEYHIPVDLSLYPPNIYLLRLRMGDQVATSRVVVQR